MKEHLLWPLALLLILAAGAGPAAAQNNAGDKEAVAANGQAFLAAFHKGDAAALAALWAPDGEYTDQAGRSLQGREAIVKAFQGFFAENKGAKAKIESDSLRFLTPDVAVEEGTTFVLLPGEPLPSRAHYEIVHVKKDGKWYLGRVKDSAYMPPTNYEQLSGLDWAVGNWSSAGGKGEQEHLTVSWTDNQNFVVATFEATVKDASIARSTHWIGWDPQQKRVRSWIFDETGGFGEGAWTRDGDGWVIKTKSVLRDGRNSTRTVRLAPAGADTITLQATDRMLGGEALPDTPVVELKRAR